VFMPSKCAVLICQYRIGERRQKPVVHYSSQ
jgi:hypothetical protein